MERFQFADQGPLPRWVRVWRAATIPVFVVVAYLVVFVDLTSRQTWVVFALWAAVVIVPTLDWMRRLREQDKNAR